MDHRTLFVLSLLLLGMASRLVPAARTSATCKASGFLRGRSNGDDCDECCKDGVMYPKFTCSPPVTSSTKAVLTVNDFSDGGDGGGASSCDGKFHNGKVERVVALSTGWFNSRKRCNKEIVVTVKGRSVRAKVVDECDSGAGCDGEHANQPPCRNNIVDGSDAVWKALGISKNDPEFGEINVTWRDA